MLSPYSGLSMTVEDIAIWSSLWCSKPYSAPDWFALSGASQRLDGRDGKLTRKLTVVGTDATKKFGNPDGVAVVHALLRNGFEPRLPR
jgi:hypothetical protein